MGLDLDKEHYNFACIPMDEYSTYPHCSSVEALEIYWQDCVRLLFLCFLTSFGAESSSLEYLIWTKVE